MSTVASWETKLRASDAYQRPEHQRLIGIYARLLEGTSAPDAAARDAAAVLDPWVQSHPADIRILAVWGVLCRAAREFGSDPEASRRLVDFLVALSGIRVEHHEHGFEVVLAGGNRRFWADLPGFALMFREYGIYVEADEDMESLSEWLAQQTPYLNATSFAATCITHAPDAMFRGTEHHVKPCMAEATDVDVEDSHPPSASPRDRTAVYVPAAAAWISIAGPALYELCRSSGDAGSLEERFSLEGDWRAWRDGLGRVAACDQVSAEIRETARGARDRMVAIEEGRA
ncbi:hypothetical protein GGR56DRAFT_613769 [Xylariaceae sp. FL0804]|nr:hypothetical protein GGR56DRAFT_613769 [Xylariaceae sp. FL0804]